MDAMCVSQDLLFVKGGNSTIGVVTHGRLIEWDALASCWPHPHNAQTFSIALTADFQVCIDRVSVVYKGGS